MGCFLEGKIRTNLFLNSEQTEIEFGNVILCKNIGGIELKIFKIFLIFYFCPEFIRIDIANKVLFIISTSQ